MLKIHLRKLCVAMQVKIGSDGPSGKGDIYICTELRVKRGIGCHQAPWKVRAAGLQKCLQLSSLD